MFFCLEPLRITSPNPPANTLVSYFASLPFLTPSSLPPFPSRHYLLKHSPVASQVPLTRSPSPSATQRPYLTPACLSQMPWPSSDFQKVPGASCPQGFSTPLPCSQPCSALSSSLETRIAGFPGPRPALQWCTITATGPGPRCQL